MLPTPEENPFEREWRGRVDFRLQSVETAVQTVGGMVTALPTRRDLEEAIRSRVDMGAYTVAHQALNDRLNRLESGPQRLVSWIALVVSAGLGCIMAAIAGLAIIVSIAGLVVTLTR